MKTEDIQTGMLLQREGHTLKVERYLGKDKSGIKIYEVSCNICKEDTELFPEYFKTRAGDLARGRTPCGCAKNPQWSELQQKIRILRKCATLGYTFTGYIGGKLNSKTYLELYNPSTNNTWETTLTNFLLNDRRDPSERLLRFSKTRGSTNIEDIKRLLKITRPEVEVLSYSVYNKPRYKYVVKYRCNICSADSVTAANLCTGVFESSLIDIKDGRLSCRCGLFKIKTEEQLIFKLKSIPSCKLLTNFKGNLKDVKVEYLCKQGHTVVKTAETLLQGRDTCLVCYPNGFNPKMSATFYIVDWFCKLSGKTYTKIGITSQDINKRIKSQKKGTKLTPSIRYTVQQSGYFIRDLETQIKRDFKTYLGVPYEIFKDGYSEVVDYKYDITEDLIEKVNLYLESAVNSENKA